MTEETVKVEVELPKNVFDAAEKVSKRFDYDFNTLCVRAIEEDLEASAAGHFEHYYRLEDVPVMVDPKTAVYLKWWYKITKQRLSFDNLSDFIMYSMQSYMIPHLKAETTDEEKQELDLMLKEIGAEEKENFAQEIKQILGVKP